jgi:hypothetical protein
MNEHSFIKSVHRYLPSDLFKWKIHDTYTGGVPDSFYAGPAGILFVEYKYVKTLPAKDSTAIKTTLSPLQAQWLNRMLDFNQRAALVIGCEDTAVILTNKEWAAIFTKKDYVARAVPRKQVATWITESCLG